jgi:hypothetical protein
MQIRLNKNKQKTEGLSIIGALIAIAIIATSLTAGLTFMINALKHATTVRHQVIASFLAEEGLELAKNIFLNAKYKNQAGYGKLTTLAINEDAATGDPLNEYGFGYNSLGNTNNGINHLLNDHLFKDGTHSGLCNVSSDPVNSPDKKSFQSCPIAGNFSKKNFFLRKIKFVKDGIPDPNNPGETYCHAGIAIEVIVYWKEDWESQPVTITTNPADLDQMNKVKTKTCVYNW